MNRLACCAPTSYGGTTVHSPICLGSPERPLNKEEYAEYRKGGKETAERFNRAAEERALLRARLDAAAKQQAKDDHPAGKGPRYRSTQLWIQCSCRTPMAGECKVHGVQI